MESPHTLYTGLFIERLKELAGVRCGFVFKADRVYDVTRGSLVPGAEWLTTHEPQLHETSALDWSVMMDHLDRAITARQENDRDWANKVPQPRDNALALESSMMRHRNFINDLQRCKDHLLCAKAKYPHHYDMNYQPTRDNSSTMPGQNDVQVADTSPQGIMHDVGDPKGQSTSRSSSPHEQLRRPSQVSAPKDPSDERTASPKKSSNPVKVSPRPTVQDSSSERTPSSAKSSIGLRERVRKRSKALMSKAARGLRKTAKNKPKKTNTPKKKKHKKRPKTKKEKKDEAPPLDQNDHLQAQEVGFVRRYFHVALQRISTFNWVEWPGVRWRFGG